MKVRDLFLGYQVQIAPADDRWTVALVRPTSVHEAFQTYSNLPDALEAAHDLLLLLVDDTEVVEDIIATDDDRDSLRHALATQTPGEPLELPEDIDAPNERDRLRDWFMRQMGHD
jgi:hypothetical protein